MKDRIAYTACPLCGSGNFAHYKTGDASRHHSYKPPLSRVMQWNACKDCGHVFTAGYYTDEALGIIFGATQDVQVVGNDAEVNRHVSARMIDRVVPYRRDGIWLDVGFGNGSLIFTAQEYGFDVVGLDLRPQSVEGLRRLGFTAHCQDLMEFTAEAPLSVISMADVLEHMPFPKPALEKSRDLLAPGGALLISMPNSDQFIWTMTTAQNNNPFWGEIEHYHNFSRKRLYALLEECGFEPKAYGVSERYRMCMEVVAVKR